MVSVMKSPNIMSTTGRSPVMAAPTASPVKPASEMGVSSTRSLPNSSSSPESTLNGVPASATSSPMMQTVGSRRISSARASRIACANVSSRCSVAIASGVHVLRHFVRGRVRCRYREFDRFLHLAFEFGCNGVEACLVRDLLLDQPFLEIRDGIPLGLPGLFLLLGAVVFAVDVANVMSVIAVGIAKQKAWTGSAPGAIDQHLRKFVYGAHVLSIDRDPLQSERGRARQNIAGGGQN